MRTVLILRGKMNYNTKSRREVLALFEGGDVTLTTDEITKKLDGVPVSTLYRRLAALCDEGLLLRFRADDGSYVYRAAHTGGCDCAFHLKCRECGCVEHMECEHGKELLDHIGAHHGFSLDNAKTVLYGRCASCSRKAAK